MTKFADRRDATETIYCANTMCRSEARYVTQSGTPICAACQAAYTWGQANPDALIYDIEAYGLYQAYLKRWSSLHGEKNEIWNGVQIIKKLAFDDFVNLAEEMDDLKAMLEQQPSPHHTASLQNGLADIQLLLLL